MNVLLKKIFVRIPKKDFNNEILEAFSPEVWNLIVFSTIPEAINIILNFARNESNINIQLKDVLRFDLQCLSKYLKPRKIWQGYKYHSIDERIFTTDSLKKSLENNDELRKKTIVSVYGSKEVENLIWISVWFIREKQIIYSVFHPAADSFSCTFAKNILLDKFLNAMQSALISESIKKISLNGYCPLSILQVRLNKIHDNLNIIRKKKPETMEKIEQLSSEVIVIPSSKDLYSENERNIKFHRVDYEILEKTENKNIRLALSFQGSNVCEGLEEMYKVGVIQKPPPEALLKLPLLGKNSIKLQF